MLAKFDAGNRAGVHFIRAIGQPQRALMRISRRQAKVVGNTAAAMRLNGIVDNLQRHIRGLHLNHRDFTSGDFVADCVHHMRRL